MNQIIPQNRDVLKLMSREYGITYHPQANLRLVTESQHAVF